MISEPEAAASPRETIRAELETTRRAYLELLDSIPPNEWKRKSGNQRWNVEQLLWHIAWGVVNITESVEGCRREKNFNPPSRLMNPMNTLYTRRGSRRATPESLRALYEKCHIAALAKLDTIRDDEWQRGTKRWGVQQTVVDAFHYATGHFHEHAADIRQGLGRAESEPGTR